MVSTRRSTDDGNTYQLAVNNAADGKAVVLNSSRMSMVLANERICLGKR
jgi:hypothetical protein